MFKIGKLKILCVERKIWRIKYIIVIKLRDKKCNFFIEVTAENWRKRTGGDCLLFSRAAPSHTRTLGSGEKVIIEKRLLLSSLQSRGMLICAWPWFIMVWVIAIGNSQEPSCLAL